MIGGWIGTALALGVASAKPVLPPFANAYEPRSVAERGIWMEADEDERKLRDSALVIHDDALTGYVRRVLCRTVGEDRCASARVYVMRVPSMNANMAANGRMVVWSGLLLRARNEAELAAILGHEFAHFEQRHLLARAQHTRSMTNIVAWAGMFGGSMAPAIQSSAIGSIFSFSRDEEREADLMGARYMLAAGYDGHALYEIWQRTMDEADATASGRKQHSQRYTRVAFFDTHPTDLERAGYLHKAADLAPAGGETGETAFAAAMKPWRDEFLADQLKLNDFGGTDYLLGQLASGGWTEDLLFARAELFRARGNPRDLVSAAGFYREAIELNATRAESYRGLGLALMRGGDAAGGGEALHRYLVLKPDAPDAAMIATLLPS